MKLKEIPFDGLFVIYKRAKNGDMQRIASGLNSADIPDDYKLADIIRIYPFDDSIVVEIK